MCPKVQVISVRRQNVLLETGMRLSFWHKILVVIHRFCLFVCLFFAVFFLLKKFLFCFVLFLFLFIYFFVRSDRPPYLFQSIF